MDGNLRRSHVAAHVLFRAAAVLRRDGRAEVQADCRLPERRLRGTERVRARGHPQGHQRRGHGVQPGRNHDTPIETIQQITDQTTDPSLRVGERFLRGRDGRSHPAENCRAPRRDRIGCGQTQGHARRRDPDRQGGRRVRGAHDHRAHPRAGLLPVGSADLNTAFLPVMQRIRDALVGDSRHGVHRGAHGQRSHARRPLRIELGPVVEPGPVRHARTPARRRSR
jgi:hypothetical protein